MAAEEEEKFRRAEAWLPGLLLLVSLLLLILALCVAIFSSLSAQLDSNFDAISMHGQTVRHLEKIESIQAGNPKFLYEKFNVPIIHNFRYADILEGGNGAPLMPFLDWLLFKNMDKDIITLNIGEVDTYLKTCNTGEGNDDVYCKEVHLVGVGRSNQSFCSCTAFVGA